MSKTINFNTENDDTFLSIALKALTLSQTAIKVNGDGIPFYSPLYFLASEWSEIHGPEYPVISGLQYDPGTDDFTGPPCFVLVSTITKVEVV